MSKNVLHTNLEFHDITKYHQQLFGRAAWKFISKPNKLPKPFSILRFDGDYSTWEINNKYFESIGNVYCVGLCPLWVPNGTGGLLYRHNLQSDFETTYFTSKEAAAVDLIFHHTLIYEL